MATSLGRESVHRWIGEALAGSDRAWARLLQELWTTVEERVRTSRRMGQLRGSDDDRREVVTRVFARLRRNDLRALRTFPAWSERNPGKTFDDWTTILVTNVIRDYVRERLGDVDEHGQGLKRLVNTLAESLDEVDARGERAPLTDRLTMAALLDRAGDIVPADQLAALGSWLRGADFAQIATEHALASSDAARGLVRAALARLRREFRDMQDDEERRE